MTEYSNARFRHYVISARISFWTWVFDMPLYNNMYLVYSCTYLFAYYFREVCQYIEVLAS